MNVIGILTWETVPGLNRHCRNALRAELSSIGLPVLCVIEPSVTLPLAASTVTTQIPLPVILRERASYGYWGRGAFIARAFALDIVIAWALTGVNFWRNIFWRRSGLRWRQCRLDDRWCVRRNLYHRCLAPLSKCNRGEVNCHCTTQSRPQMPARGWLEK